MQKGNFQLTIPKRREDSNKGSYGKILLIAGSKGMCGAAFFSGLAAYRSGAGLVKIYTEEANRATLQTLLPEAIIACREEGDEDAFREMLHWASFLVVGPGLGTGSSQMQLLREILTQASRPLLLDADGLNVLSQSEELMALFSAYAKRYPTVVTPHPMEMARLLHRDIREVLAAPEEAACSFAGKTAAITLLKGAHTLVFWKTEAEEGVQETEGPIPWQIMKRKNGAGTEVCFQCLSASPALSKGGSGDVLSGCIPGIFSVLSAEERMGKTEEKAVSEERLFRAVCLGVLVHGEAGRIAGRSVGEHGVLPRETADALGAAMTLLQNEGNDEGTN